MEKKKITIGLFNDSFLPMTDGVIFVVDNYARRLTKYANVIVFVPRYYKNKIDDSKLPYKIVKCRSLKTPFYDYPVPLPKLDSKFVKELNNYNLDIVHVHSPFLVGKAGLKYAKKHNIPCVATMHSQFKQDFEKAFKNKTVVKKLTDSIIRFFSKFDECWAVNSEVARIFHEDYGYKKMPLVMNNATEMLPVKDIKVAKKRINDLYHISNDTIVFLFVGRINTLKNILFIADSLKYVKDHNPNLKFKMFYVGAGKDTSKLKNKIDELCLNDDVVLCGKILDRELLTCFYARADLFLFPSVYDASSIVQIEAASQHTPCLFLKGTATAATVIDNQNGFLSDYSVECYGKKIIEIISDKDKLHKISENAFKELYVNWDDKVKEVYDNYIRLIEERKKSNNNGN